MFFVGRDSTDSLPRRVSMRSNATKNFASTMGKLGRAQLGEDERNVEGFSPIPFYTPGKTNMDSVYPK